MDIQHFKNKLLKEKETLEKELGEISVQSPKNDEIWETKQTLSDDSTKADANEVADKLEEYETNDSIRANLETQLTEVNDALDKIEKGTYGICEKSNHPIEPDRLEANPAARTCKAHMND
jgi:RNA polymerase-binding transcription factor DksA